MRGSSLKNPLTITLNKELKMSDENKVVDTRLSYSSATLLKNCSQKYYYYKVAGVAKDPDAEENYDAFNIGKAFHWVLETNGHTESRLEELLEEACNTFEVQGSKSMIHAMLLRYLQVHQESGLEVVHCEFELSTDIFIGFIDVILKDSEGNWWIADLKTASRFSEITAAKLHNDVQLNLYASFSKEIGEYFGLDPKKFKGARYRVTTKSVLKQKVDESYYAHVKRTAKNVKSYDIIVPLDKMNPKKTFEEHKELHKDTLKMREGKLKPVKNLSWCDSYFKPCEYWSKCHGCTFTECKESVDMLTSGNV